MQEIPKMGNHQSKHKYAKISIGFCFGMEGVHEFVDKLRHIWKSKPKSRAPPVLGQFCIFSSQSMASRQHQQHDESDDSLVDGMKDHELTCWNCWNWYMSRKSSLSGHDCCIAHLQSPARPKCCLPWAEKLLFWWLLHCLFREWFYI